VCGTAPWTLLLRAVDAPTLKGSAMRKRKTLQRLVVRRGRGLHTGLSFVSLWLLVCEQKCTAGQLLRKAVLYKCDTQPAVRSHKPLAASGTDCPVWRSMFDTGAWLRLSTVRMHVVENGSNAAKKYLFAITRIINCRSTEL
jgi:hypothetical protein